MYAATLEFRMPFTPLDEIVKDPLTTTGVVGALGGALLWIRKYFKDMGLEDKARNLDVAKISGAEDIILLLRDEVTRLAEMNRVLSGEIKTLQAEIVALRTENASLQFEIEGLNGQISRLRLSTDHVVEPIPDTEKVATQVES